MDGNQGALKAPRVVEKTTEVIKKKRKGKKEKKKNKDNRKNGIGRTAVRGKGNYRQKGGHFKGLVFYGVGTLS